jgi:hypothetical protein
MIMTDPKKVIRPQAAAHRTGAVLWWLTVLYQLGRWIMAPMVNARPDGSRKAQPTAEPSVAPPGEQQPNDKFLRRHFFRERGGWALHGRYSQFQNSCVQYGR